MTTGDIGGQVVVADAHRERLTFTGFKFAGLSKGFQFSDGFLHCTTRSTDVELHSLLATHAAVFLTVMLASKPPFTERTRGLEYSNVV